MKSGLQSPKSKKVVTLAALSPDDIHQAGIYKQKPQGRWMYAHMIAEARRTAGKSRLETVLLIQPKPEEARSRKAEGQSGEPGLPGM